MFYQYRHDVKNWGMTFLFHQSLCTLCLWFRITWWGCWNTDHWTCSAVDGAWNVLMLVPAALGTTPREFKLWAVTKVGSAWMWQVPWPDASSHIPFPWNAFWGKITCHLEGLFELLAAAAAKSHQSCPTLCDPIDGTQQAPLSLGFSRQEHWSGLPFPSPMHESEVA